MEHFSHLKHVLCKITPSDTSNLSKVTTRFAHFKQLSEKMPLLRKLLIFLFYSLGGGCRY